VEKIAFQNGKVVSSQYLNKVQEGTEFTGEPRSDYYDVATSGEQEGWDIGQRDAIKDWEIANPRLEPETAIGRLAHDGIVLNGNENELLAVVGLPSTFAFEGGQGVTIEAGSFINRSGDAVSWPRQNIKLLGGAGTASYIYLLEQQDAPYTVSVSSSLPSVNEAHIPLAKITLDTNGDGLATDPDTGEVFGTGYIDIRPHTFISALNPYPRNLSNTPIQRDDYTALVSDRVIADTGNGSIIVTLPESPSDSDRIALVDISGTFDRFPLIIRTNPVSNELLNGSPDDWIVNIRDAHLELFYHAATGQWKFEEAPGSECNPVLGTFLSCGGKEFIGDRTIAECPDGARLPTTYPILSAGVYSFEPSQADPTLGKCYRQYDETVALYANGTGGLVNVPQAPRCNRSNASFTPLSRNTIYIDQTIGEDSIDNRGFDKDRPFRTIERALLEGVRESRRSGQNNDRYDKVMLEIAPGDYYVDNSPGVLSGLTVSEGTGLVQKVDTGFTISNSVIGDKATTIVVNVGNSVNTQPPRELNLGRVLYSESGGVGNIARVQKQSGSSSNWIISLEYVGGTFEVNDKLFFDNLAVVNPQTGGLIIPRGISVDGVDLRKVRIRPMYVPELSPVQNDPQTEKTAIFKVTGGTYVSLMTFTDNLQYSRSHNTVTAIEFASEQEIIGGGSETSYYSRINSLFKDVDGWEDELLEAIAAETTIVAPIASTKQNRSQDIEENQTGIPSPDSDSNAAVMYPGATRIRNSDGAIVPLPDINSTRSSSPYVFNCSVRSIFGLNGLWANGSRVSGFKSMVTANFTQVSLQTDPNCYLDNTYFQDPPINKTDSEGKKYKSSNADKFKYRHFGIRGSNDATIQIVSVFCIGNSDHFISESGADLSITNSCSDFGDISLRGIGYKAKSFSQDQAAPATEYSGTRITQIVPPLPLQYTQLPDGRPATLEDIEVSTGLVIDYNKTLAYVLANKTGENEAPETIRIYVQNSNIASPFSLERPPSASNIAFGQYSYTKKIGTSTWELSGGPNRPNRKRIYINGFDEVGNSILYTGDLQLAATNSPGFGNLDDSSKIFAWDSAPIDIDQETGNTVTGSPAWYINVTTQGISEESTDQNADGYLTKRFNYAFRYKLIDNPTGQDAVFASLDFMFNRSAVKIIRAIDQRRADDRVYRVVLEGFERLRGMRRPQPYYVLEKQSGVAGFPLNNSSELEDNPLTITQVRTYEEVFTPGASVQNSGKYVTYLTQGSRARDVFTGDFYPSLDSDYPELTEDPVESATKQALALMQARASVNFSAPLQASTEPITVRTSASASVGILIGLRRPSVIRASGHTWEWTGYLNYDTSFPTFQGEPLEQEFILGKIITEENGGRVYATGMNEEGNYYLGTTVFDLRSGEQFSIPYASESGAEGLTNQVLNNVIIRSTLLMQDGSSLIMGRGTSLFFSNDTQFKSLTTGDIIASPNPPLVYASRDRAGIVQLAKKEDIRGAKNPAFLGISDKVAVTAFDLANELDARLNNNVTGGRGISVTQVNVEIPGGDPNDPSDDIAQFVVNSGLPGNTDAVGFSSLCIGEDPSLENSTKLTSLRTSSQSLPVRDESNASDSALVTEKGIAKWAKDIPGYVKSQGTSPYIVLHVSRGTPLTGENSVPGGYFETNEVSYSPNSSSIFRRTIFQTVTDALEFAAGAYLPLGAELVISVHDNITATEAGPLMIANSWSTVVVAGARGAVTTPKIRINIDGSVPSDNTKFAGTRIPQVIDRAISAGIIFQDLTIDINTNGTNAESTYLTLNGGFGVNTRDTVINWLNCSGSSASGTAYSQVPGKFINATASVGEKTQIRVTPELTTSGSDYSIVTNLEMANTSQKTFVAFFDQAGGLLGQNCDIVFDFRRASYGDGGNKTLEFKFTHNSSEPCWVKMLGMGGRGNCRITSRIAPFVKWNFDNKDWDMKFFYTGFLSNPNTCGLSFKPFPYSSGVYKISQSTAQSILSSGAAAVAKDCIISGLDSASFNSGPFSIYQELAGKTVSTVSIPSVLLKKEVPNSFRISSPDGTEYDISVSNAGVLQVDPV
jgi:hypothetical protein